VHSADEHDHAGKLDAIGSICCPTYRVRILHPDAEGRFPRSSTGRLRRPGCTGERLQLGPYRHSRWLVLPDGSEIEMPPRRTDDRSGTLTADGYSAIPAGDGQDVYRDFLFIKEVARIVQDSKFLRGDPLIPPAPPLRDHEGR